MSLPHVLHHLPPRQIEKISRLAILEPDDRSGKKSAAWHPFVCCILPKIHLYNDLLLLKSSSLV
jgi:hypothetical protein